jgi:4-carboxymuconolactone decarboxylase
VHGGPDDDCWNPQQGCIIRLADQLHDTSTVGGDLFADLTLHFGDDQILELAATAG